MTRQRSSLSFFIALNPLCLDAKPVVAQRTIDLRLGVLLRGYLRPPLPPSFAPIPPPGRYWCCFIAHHHPTQPCLPSVRPLLLSQVPMPPPSLRTWGCYCAGICAPPLPLSFAPIPPRDPFTTSRKLRPTPDLPGPSSVHFLRPLSPALPPLTVCPRLHTRPTAPHGCTHHDVRLMPRLITTISYS